MEEARQREAAEWLYQNGAEVDLGYAAGLGELTAMQGFLKPDGTPGPDAYTRYRSSKSIMKRPTKAAIMQEALLFACANGRTDAVEFLLSKGAAINGRSAFGSYKELTPLHAAAWAGWADTVALLVQRGGDPTLAEPTHQGTPRDWAKHCQHMQCAEILS